MSKPFNVPQDAGIVRGHRGRFQASRPQAKPSTPKQAPAPDVPASPKVPVPQQQDDKRPFRV